MRRFVMIKAAAAVLLLCSAVWAQEVVIRGFVENVDPRNLTITLRTTGYQRVVQVAPTAVVTMNGRAASLAEIPLNSEVLIRAISGPNDVPRATRVMVTGPSNLPPAAEPPGSRFTGTITNVNVPSNQVTLRVPAGDMVLPIGQAPIVGSGGRELSLPDLRVGDRILVERGIPTARGTNYVTQRVVLLGRAGGAAMDRADEWALSGRIMGVDLPSNYIRVRTPTGDVRLSVAGAPIYVNGRRTDLSRLRVGDRVRVERASPELAGRAGMVQSVTVTERAAGYRGATRSRRY